MNRKPRMRKCKGCGERFQPVRPLQVACSPMCAHAHARAERMKAERKAIRERKLKIKTRSDFVKEAQVAFNAYVRARDAGLPCICCGRIGNGQTRGGEWDAGHYRSRGAAPHLRFDERNCHAQLKQCNRYGAGRAVDYRLGLIARIGLEAVEALEADHEPRKWTVEELMAIKREYVAKRKAVEAQRMEVAA